MKTYLPIILILFTTTSYTQDQQIVPVLDSVYYYQSPSGQDWEESSLTYYEHDSEGKIVEKRLLVKNAQHGWSTEKEIYHYNLQKLQDTITLATWYDAQNDWFYHAQKIYKYNSENQLLKYTNRIWNETTRMWEIFSTMMVEYDDQNRWINQLMNETSRRIRTYDDDNRLSRDAFEYLENEQWFTLYSTTFEYNEFDQITRIYYTNDAFNPPTNRETIYTYNNLNRRTSQIISETNAWGQVPPLKDTFVYNIDNQLVKRQKADLINGNWIWHNSRYLYEYDDNENPTISIIQIRHTPNHNWQNSSKDEYFYNTDNRETDIYRYMVWDTINAEWYNGEWTNYVYNQNNNRIEETTKRWENGTNDYTQNYSKLVNYFSEKTFIPIEPPTIEENCPFPNPYLQNSMVHCENWEVEKTYQLRVFSIDGKFAYSTEFLGCEGFQINQSLQKGWYIFTVTDNGNILQKQKILIFD